MDREEDIKKRPVRCRIGHLDQTTGEKVRGCDEGAAAVIKEPATLPRTQPQSQALKMQLKIIETNIARLNKECAVLREVKEGLADVLEDVQKEGAFFQTMGGIALETPMKVRSAAEWMNIAQEEFPNLATKIPTGGASSSAGKNAGASGSTSKKQNVDSARGSGHRSGKETDVKGPFPKKFYKDLHTEEDEEAYRLEMLD